MSNYGWGNLHKHYEFSSYDGLGKSVQAAPFAKSLGQTALGVSEHGSVSGLVQHYKACKENEIKPVLGCEVYFLPQFKEGKKPYHMCLFIKNYTGFKNLMKLMSIAAEKSFYRVPIITGENLRKYSEGLICSSACIGGYLSQPLLKGKPESAEKHLKQLKAIFKEDFYIEIMPYKVEDHAGNDIQLDVDNQLLKLAKKHDVKCILTTDSHFTKKEDYETWLLMFKMRNKKVDLDYSERYMPSEADIALRFEMRHNKSATPLLKNTAELISKCEPDYLDNMKEELPLLKWDRPSKEQLKYLVGKGLKKRGKYEDKKYRKQALHELSVIEGLGFEDYFLLCYDIVRYAKNNGIGYGYGRGSVCGSLVAYLLGITEVDTIELGTIFERFLRPDKKKMPDVDMDFCTHRRKEVFQYIMDTHKGRAAQVATYGYYKVDNLINDLAKSLDIDPQDVAQAKQNVTELYPKLEGGDIVEYDKLMSNHVLSTLEKRYKFCKHFSNMCGQLKYIGKHSGGVAITKRAITDYAAIMKVRGEFQTCFNLEDLEFLKVLKMDILGLSTVTINQEIEHLVGVPYSPKMYKDRRVLKAFSEGRTEGIFQMDRLGAQEVLRKLNVDNIQDVIASIALNRPVPLAMGIPDMYGEAKQGNIPDSLSTKYLPETYGCLVYQEDIIRLCKGLSDVDWSDIDKLMKGVKGTASANRIKEQFGQIEKQFVKKAVECNPKLKSRKQELSELFQIMTGGYLFNKGHAAGYSLLSVQQMYYKIYFPHEFWAVTLSNEKEDFRRGVYEAVAVQNDDIIIVPPHINHAPLYQVVEVLGEKCISKGIATIKGIGVKAATIIQQNGPYQDYAEFEENCLEGNKRVINTRVMKILRENDCFEFNDKKNFAKMRHYNKKLASAHYRLR